MAQCDEASVAASADAGVSGIPAELAEARATIDNIDAALVHILAERFRCTQRVGHMGQLLRGRLVRLVQLAGQRQHAVIGQPLGVQRAR